MQIYLLVSLPPCAYLLHFYFVCTSTKYVVIHSMRPSTPATTIITSMCVYFFRFCNLSWTESLNDKTAAAAATATPAKILSVDGLNSNLLSLVDYYSFAQQREK